MLNWSAIDTVLLDMDGTLLDLHFDNFFWLEHLPEQYAKHRGISLDDARSMLQDMSAALKGSLNWYCVDYWSDALELDIETLKIQINHLVRFRPQTVEFLNYIKKLNKEAILVTNAHPKSLQLKSEASGLDQYLDRMISSHEFSLAKENTGFWAQLEQREALDLSRCLFIDDSLPVLHCAHAEGIGQTVHILQPDSKLPPVEAEAFPGIVAFSEIMTTEND